MDNSARIGRDAGVQIMDRQIRITKKDLICYGFTPNCPRCLDLEAGIPKSNYYDYSDPKWRAIKSKMPGHSAATGDKEEINLDGMAPGAMEEETNRSSPPSTPLPEYGHFQPDRRTPQMMADEGLQPPPPMLNDSYGMVFEDEQEMDVADLFGDFDHDNPNDSAMDNQSQDPTICSQL